MIILYLKKHENLKNQKVRITKYQILARGKLNYYKETFYNYNAGGEIWYFYVEYSDDSWKRVTYRYYHNKFISYLLKCQVLNDKYGSLLNDIRVDMLLPIIKIFNEECDN